MARYLIKCVCKTVRKKDGSIIQEFAKEMQNAASIGGKVWDCSINLKAARYYTIDCGGSIADETVRYISYRAQKEGKTAHTDNCTIYSFKRDAYRILPQRFFIDDYFTALQNILNYERAAPTAKKNPPEAVIEHPPRQISKPPPNLFSYCKN